MNEKKIKVSAPRKNPHICYVQRAFQPKIESIKSKTGMTLFNLIQTCSGGPLQTEEQIKAFKNKIKESGFKNIGEWTETLIDYVHENLYRINQLDLSSIEIEKEDYGYTIEIETIEEE